jgi:hypothetical protein
MRVSSTSPFVTIMADRWEMESTNLSSAAGFSGHIVLKLFMRGERQTKQMSVLVVYSSVLDLPTPLGGGRVTQPLA